MKGFMSIPEHAQVIHDLLTFLRGEKLWAFVKDKKLRFLKNQRMMDGKVSWMLISGPMALLRIPIPPSTMPMPWSRSVWWEKAHSDSPRTV
jgi:hypothetical protein